MKWKLGNVSLCGGPVQKQWFFGTQSPSYFHHGFCIDLLWGHFEVIIYISSLTFYIYIYYYYYYMEIRISGHMHTVPVLGTTDLYPYPFSYF